MSVFSAVSEKTIIWRQVAGWWSVQSPCDQKWLAQLLSIEHQQQEHSMELLHNHCQEVAKKKLYSAL